MFKSLDKLFSSSSVSKLVFIITLIAIIISVVLVYILKIFIYSEYTHVSFVISAVIPLIMVPPSIIFVVYLTTNLKTYKDDLAREVEKNQQKDILLFEQARFVLMGEMMANISHQWKQPLNNIGLAIVSSRLGDSDGNIEKNFDIMEENINYLSTTIDDFMSFFDKKNPVELRAVGDIVDEIQSIMRAQIESCGIRLTINIDAEIKVIKIKSVISQVLLNLLSNAKDAMDESKSEKEIVLCFEAINNGIQISCCDNGLGVDENIITKIFDPYFSTKDKKQGTGIGLYMSKQIVDKIFDGTIVLDDTSKETCFRIDIPCSKNCKLEEVFEL